MRFPKEVREALVALRGEDFVQKLEAKSHKGAIAHKSFFADWQPTLPAGATTKRGQFKSLFADWQPDLTGAKPVRRDHVKPYQRSATAKAASKPRHMLAGLIKSQATEPHEHMLAMFN